MTTYRRKHSDWFVEVKDMQTHSTDRIFSDSDPVRLFQTHTDRMIWKIVGALAVLGFGALSIWLGVLADVGDLPTAEVWGNKVIGGAFGIIATLIFLGLMSSMWTGGASRNGSEDSDDLDDRDSTD